MPKKSGKIDELPKRALFLPLWDLTAFSNTRVKMAIRNDHLVDSLEQEKLCVIMPMLGEKKEFGKVGFLVLVDVIARGKDGAATIVEVAVVERAKVTDIRPRPGASAKEKLLDCEWLAINEPEITEEAWASPDFQDRLSRMKECFVDACFLMRVLTIKRLQNEARLRGAEAANKKMFRQKPTYADIASYEKAVFNAGRNDLIFVIDTSAAWLSELLDAAIGLKKLTGTECIPLLEALMFSNHASERVDVLALLAIFLAEQMADVLSLFDTKADTKGQMIKRDDFDDQFADNQFPPNAESQFPPKMPKGQFPPNVEKVIRDLSKRANPNTQDGQVVITYLEWIYSLPWIKTTEDEKNFSKVSEALEADHYGLQKAKKRILQFIAIRKTKSNARAPILCFVGPPGVGKTSLGESIARAMGRKFICRSLGGVKDEADLRGHRRTYIGALPGMIIDGLREVGVKNPVFMLDEIDKLGEHGRDVPAHALMEILDSKQNHSFRDHYIDLPFDLSEVLFIMTANMTETIHEAVRNRMAIIELPAYAENEKIEIAYRHVLPKCLLDVGIEAKNLEEKNLPVFTVDFSREAMEWLVGEYTHDSGMRDTERAINDILAEILKKVHENSWSELEFEEKDGLRVIKITGQKIKKFLGESSAYNLLSDSDLQNLPSGTAVVLMVDFSGRGLVDAAEVSIRRANAFGKKNTGHLEQVLDESIDVAISRLIHKGGVLEGVSHKLFVHTHFPEGAIPKDGPSAGVQLFTADYGAILSLVSPVSIKPFFAATGEITLNLGVLPVGGVRSKLLAARKAGIREVAIPLKCKKDLDEFSIKDFKVIAPADKGKKSWREISKEPKIPGQFTVYCIEKPEDNLELAFPDHYPPSPETINAINAYLSKGNGGGNGGNAEKK